MKTTLTKELLVECYSYILQDYYFNGKPDIFMFAFKYNESVERIQHILDVGKMIYKYKTELN